MDLGKICEKANRTTFNYVVDYIIAKRVCVNGKVEYLVKWNGWNHRESTWEPANNFASRKIIDIFEKGLQNEMGIIDEETMFSSVDVKPCKRGRGRPPKPFDDRIRLGKNGIKSFNISNNKNCDVFKEPESQTFNQNYSLSKKIAHYESILGSSPKKSRMSCFQSPPLKLKPAIISDRTKRHHKREVIKDFSNIFCNESNPTVKENEKKSSNEESKCSSGGSSPENQESKSNQESNPTNPTNQTSKSSRHKKQFCTPLESLSNDNISKKEYFLNVVKFSK